MNSKLKTPLWIVGALVALGIVAWPYVNVALLAPYDFTLDGIGANRIEMGSGPTYSNLLRVYLKSRVDIQSLAVRHSLFIYEIVSPCENGQLNAGRELWNDMFPGNWIYDGIGAVDLWSRAPDGTAYRTAPSGPKDSVGKMRYSFFFNPEFHRRANDRKDPYNPLRDQYEYDFRTSPEDLCVRVFGRGNFGLGAPVPTVLLFQSNTVVIPKELVSAAIKKYKLE